MLFNWSSPKHRNIAFAQYGLSRIYIGKAPDITVKDLLVCCETNYAMLVEVLRIIKRQGFKRDKPSRAELMKKNEQILTELRDMRKVIQRMGKPGGYNGKN